MAGAVTNAVLAFSATVGFTISLAPALASPAAPEMTAEALAAPVEAVVAEAPVGDEATPVRATVAEGGRDLRGRLHLEREGSWRPSLTVELDGDAGEVPELIGKGVTYYRVQPYLVGALQPRADVKVFAGAGLGGAIVIDPSCPSCLVGAEHPSGPVQSTLGLQAGARLANPTAPQWAFVQIDHVASRGTSAMLLYMLEMTQ